MPCATEDNNDWKDPLWTDELRYQATRTRRCSYFIKFDSIVITSASFPFPTRSTLSLQMLTVVFLFETAQGHHWLRVHSNVPYHAAYGH